MSANPPLTQLPDGSLAPTVADGELLVLARPGMRWTVDGVRTPSKKWTAKGILYLTTTRLVFIAGGGPPDPSGLVAFALPFTALAPSTEFKQPIFAANHLSGVCAGATGEAHVFKLEFKEGGVGTFLPLYFRLLEYARAVAASGGGGGAGGSGAAAAAADAKPAPPPAVAQAVATAFVDPSDPSKLFLTQPDGGK